MNIKRLIFLFILVLFISSCAPLSTEGEEEECPYTLQITIEDDTYDLTKGNYKCTFRDGFTKSVEMTDVASPNQMAEHLVPIQAKTGEEVYFETAGSPNLTIYLWNTESRHEEIPSKEQKTFTLPTESGEYLFEVVGEWKKDTVHYVFLLELTDN